MTKSRCPGQGTLQAPLEAIKVNLRMVKWLSAILQLSEARLFVCKAGHKCTHGWPGSVPTGILGTNSHTQICEDSFPQITQSHKSKTHKFTGTHGYSLMTDLHRYSQVYSWVPASRTENLCWLDGGHTGLSELDLIIPSQQMIKSHAVNNKLLQLITMLL